MLSTMVWNTILVPTYMYVQDETDAMGVTWRVRKELKMEYFLR